MRTNVLAAFAFASALALGSVSMAHAGHAGHAGSVPSLPSCTGGYFAEGACFLALKNGGFDDGMLASWERVGLPGHGIAVDGSTYAALPLGSGIQQAVYAHGARNTADVVYTLRFRIRAEHAPADVRATLAMSTAERTDLVPLGHVTSMALTDEWSTVELSVQGRPYAAPAHVLVTIDNEGGTPATVHVDDIVLIQSSDAEVAGL
jgi:hypothetical protein